MSTDNAGDAVDVRNVGAEHVGPEYYDTRGVGVVLGADTTTPLSPAAVRGRRLRHQVLALQTSDGRWVYPTWQFTGSGTVLPGLAEVLTIFAAVPSWSTATWLTTPQVYLDEMTPAQWLIDGHDQARLLEACQRRAALWSQ